MDLKPPKLGESNVKIGAKAARHATYVRLQLAEVAAPRRLFAAILNHIQQFRKETAGLVFSG